MKSVLLTVSLVFVVAIAMNLFARSSYGQNVVVERDQCFQESGHGNTMVTHEFTDVGAVEVKEDRRLDLHNNDNTVVECHGRNLSHSPVQPYFFFNIGPYGHYPFSAAGTRDRIVFACRDASGVGADVGWAWVEQCPRKGHVLYR